MGTQVGQGILRFTESPSPAVRDLHLDARKPPPHFSEQLPSIAVDLRVPQPRITEGNILAAGHDTSIGRRPGVEIRPRRFPDETTLTPALERGDRLRDHCVGAMKLCDWSRQKFSGLVSGRDHDFSGADTAAIALHE